MTQSPKLNIPKHNNSIIIYLVAVTSHPVSKGPLREMRLVGFTLIDPLGLLGHTAITFLVGRRI